MRIIRGDRIGLIGPNGAGKSTMIRLILGTLAPDAGTVRLGTGLQVAYFDQMREQLDLEQSVADTISPGSEWVTIGGERKHVMSYLGDFLFPPRRVQAKVSSLSGGERNRLLLARLFARPANLLVLDEPTNDLDIESLELLESTLQDYGGTLLLVSHDRAFLDNVVTQTLVAEGGGKWREYVGGYSDWLAQRPAPAAPQTPAPAARVTKPPPREAQKVKLSFKEQRDLESLPAEIEALEREQHELTAQMASADYHRHGPERIKADRQRATEIERLLESKFERWSALEEKAKVAATG
jgi:ATP-binding cassette subfamily F protein uup